MASWRAASVSGAAAFAVLVAAEIAALMLVLRWRSHASRRYGLE